MNITMAQAIDEARDGFVPVFRDKQYGDRLPFCLNRDGTPVYAGTPFEDLNGTPVQDQDMARYMADLGIITSGRYADGKVDAAPFMFFEEV